jgi:hypothetical protein
MIRTRLLIAVCTVLTFSACSSDSEVTEITPVPLSIQANILENASTRVTDASWGGSDCIYLRGVKGGEVALDNVCYQFDSMEGWQPRNGASTYYFQDTQVLTLTAVHIPGDQPLEKVEETLTDPQDYLFAPATQVSYINQGVANLEFEHVMARVTFHFEAGSGADLMAIYDMTFNVYGFYSGSFNTITGETSFHSDDRYTLEGQLNGKFIYVFPQSGVNLELTFSYNNLDYTATISNATFAAGTDYEYLISLGDIAASASTD